jgi:hypothetical protein
MNEFAIFLCGPAGGLFGAVAGLSVLMDILFFREGETKYGAYAFILLFCVGLIAVGNALS